MSEHDWSDRFVARLLDERLGGDGAPDARRQVFARIRRRRRHRAALRFGVALAAAAMIMIVVGAHLWTPPPSSTFVDADPGLRIEGAYTVADGGLLRRGATVRAGDDGATLHLGPHISVVMDADTALTIGDADDGEAVSLANGAVHCSVQKGQGGFCVKTDLGTVSVVGTEFSVELVEELTDMTAKQMVVSVLAGVVLVAGPAGETMVKAGETKAVTAPKPNKAVTMPGRIFGRSAGNAEGLMTMERNHQSALMISSSVLQDKLNDMQQKALESKPVTTAHEKALGAEEAYRKMLVKNKTVKALNEEKEKLQEMRATIKRPDHRDREAWRDFHKDFAALHKQINEKQQEVFELVMNDPELSKAREAAEEAWLAFLDAYMAALEEMDGYAQLVEQIEQRQSWLRESWQERAYQQRQERKEEKEKAEARREAERKKNAPQDAVDVDPAATF